MGRPRTEAMVMRLRSALIAGAGVWGVFAATSQVVAQPPALPRPYAPAANRQEPLGDPHPVRDVSPINGLRATWPIDLPTALRLADANNPTVGVARARVREAM